MITSRKGILFGLAGVGILSIIVMFVASSASLPIEGGKSVNSIAGQNNEPSEYFTITQCGESGIAAAVSIVDVDGFVAVQPRTSTTPEIVPGTPTSGPRIGIYEFVLQPGSTGSIIMTYDFCPAERQVMGEEPSRLNIVNSTELRYIFDQTNSTNSGMYILNEEAKSSVDRLIFVPPGNSTEITISAGEITKVDEHTIEVIYAISASPEADDATFITANFYKVCPGEILTIGKELNEKSLDWSKGPFYGCRD